MRRGLLVACVSMACSFDASSGASESETIGETDSTGEAVTSALPSSGSGDEDSSGEAAATSSTGAPGSSTEGVHLDETTTSSSGGDDVTSSTTASDVDTSTTADPPALSDDGVIARFFLDEADMGTGPMAALDAIPVPAPFPLELQYDGTMHYTNSLGRLGLAFGDAGADDVARSSTLGTKMHGGDGSSTLTYELVLGFAAGVGAGSHIVHFGNNGRGAATLAGDNDGELWFSWNNDLVRRWDYAPFLGAPHVVHLIVDTTVAGASSRFRLLVDGAELTPEIAQAVEMDEPLQLPDDAFFALGNRHQDRAIQGVISYAAVYGIAMDDDTVAEHVSLLFDSDDTP